MSYEELISAAAELLRQARDSNRVSDLANLNQALTLYNVNVAGGNMGSSSVVYVSVPDPTATSSLGTDCTGIGLASSSLPVGWSWHCAASSTYREVNGTGWIPVDFTKVSGGSPLGTLPVDPTNTTSTGLYYTYVVQGDSWEFTAEIESSKYATKAVTDGGLDPAMYEVGTNLTLAPFARGMSGYWPLDEGTGTTAYDASGYGDNATLSDATSTGSGPTWVTSGCLPGVGSCLSFDGTDDYVVTASNAALETGNNSSSFTIYFWMKWVSMSGQEWNSFIQDGNTTISSGIWTDYVGGGTEFSQSPFYFNPPEYQQHMIDGNWHMIAYVYSRPDNSLSLYVDGVFTGSTATPNAQIAFPGGQVYMGANNDGSASFFNGDLGPVAYYNRALSASEIQAIYNSEK